MLADCPSSSSWITMATVSGRSVAPRCGVTLFLIMTVAAVSRASLFPQPLGNGVLQRREPICIGGPSLLTTECLRPLQTEAYPTGSLEALEVYTPQELYYVCRDLVHAHSCVARVYLNCGRPNMDMQIDVMTIFGVAGYLCTKEGKRLLFSEKECLQRDEAAAVLDSCSENDEFNTTGNVCSDMQGLRRCIKKGVRKVCNRRAAKFVDKVIYYGLEPLARNKYSCDITVRIPRSLLKAMARRRRADQNSGSK